MANSFKPVAVNSISTTATIYTVPATATAVVHSVFLTNTDATSAITFNLIYFDGTTSFNILSGVSVPASTTITLDKPINLLATNQIRATVSATTNTIFLSVLEIT